MRVRKAARTRGPPAQSAFAQLSCREGDLARVERQFRSLEAWRRRRPKIAAGVPNHSSRTPITGRPELAGACGRAGQQLAVADLAPEPLLLRHGGRSESFASPRAGPPGPRAEPCARHELRRRAVVLLREVLEPRPARNPARERDVPRINDGLKRSAKILGAMDAVDASSRRRRAAGTRETPHQTPKTHKHQNAGASATSPAPATP